MMAKFTAAHLIEQLGRAGFVVMKKPPAPGHAGLTGTRPARHCRAKIDPRRLRASRRRPVKACHVSSITFPAGTPTPAAQPVAGGRSGGDATQADHLFELAQTHVALGNGKAAIAVLGRATKLSPDFTAAWRRLGELLDISGDRAGAAASDASYRAALASGNCQEYAPPPLSPAQLQAAERYWARRLDTLPTEAATSTLLGVLRVTTPGDAVALRRLSRLVEAGQRRGRLLRRALDLAPDYFEARRDYATHLFQENQHLEALPHFEKLVEHVPDNAMYRAILAVCCKRAGDYERAISLFMDCGDAFDKQPILLLSYAEALKYMGNRDASVTILRTFLQANPGSGLAWWALANVKTAPFSADDIATMRAQVTGSARSDIDRIHIHYALGYALEQAGDYAESFAHYSKGAALKHAAGQYDDSDLPSMAQRMKAFFTPARFAATTGRGLPDAAPIFIVGLPRAGSTLIEQILASHSQVEGTMELPEINNIVRDIGVTPTEFRYPEVLADFDSDALAALGRRYIERSQLYRKTDKPFFTDKMPSNWMHVGLIQMMLPNAKIIDARRHPVATCFAAFKQLFGAAADYTYDLEDLARYYKFYLDRMAHFDAVLPGRIHRVLYENMVDDTDGEIRRLLDYCGLPFEPACLRFWDNKRAVATPSAEQVRRPIFREGLDHWRNYEPWLGPLRQALNEGKPGE
jgi:tetratricopeptide (TPR) repeat protein